MFDIEFEWHRYGIYDHIIPLVFNLYISNEFVHHMYGLILNVQKVIVKLMTMNDDRTKQKAMEAVADIYGKIISDMCV